MAVAEPGSVGSPRTWRGAVFVGAGWLLYAGEVGAAALHRHHARQILVARTGVAVLAAGGAACPGVVVDVAADAAHALPAPVRSAYLLYLEADAAGARSDGPPAVRACAPAAEELADLVRQDEPRTLEAARRLARRIVGLVDATAPGPRPRDLHPSIARALVAIPALIGARGRAVRLADVAAAVGCAPDGLSRRFNVEVGMSVPAYVRWARLRFVARTLARGGTLTDAAHAAGYSDSAHLSRVFRATFGFRPSALGPRPRWAVGDLPLA